MLADLGVEFHFQMQVNAEMLAELESRHDAIFLGVGLGGIHQLGIEGEQLEGVTNALDLIAGYKSGAITSSPPRVAVVGAGNTAIDAAIASVRLGAAQVHMIYRRGLENMSAFSFEYEHAKQEGVNFHWHALPTSIVGARSVESLRITRLSATTDGSLIPEQGSEFTLPIDLVVLAIGQGSHSAFLVSSNGGAKVQVERGRIVIDRATGQTSNPKYFAGGDCTNGGREVVDAVADGKRAGIGIATWLEDKHVQA